MLHVMAIQNHARVLHDGHRRLAAIVPAICLLPLDASLKSNEDSKRRNDVQGHDSSTL